MRFTPRAALLMALASSLALVGAAPVMLLAMLAVATVAFFDALAVRRPPSVTRVVGGFARGVPTHVTITVDAPNASGIEIRQPVPPDMTSPAATTTESTLAATLIPQQRGRYELPVVAVRTDGPLGLGRWYHQHGEPVGVRVYPDLPAAQRLAQAVRQRSIRAVGSRRRGPLGLGTEFESVREYHTDDDFRQINWRATARLGRPMSNNLRVEQDADVWLIVDTGRLMSASFALRGGMANRLDLALDIAAAVGLVADDLGDRVGFIAYADRIVTTLQPRRSGGAAAIEAAFSLSPTDGDSDHQTAFAAMASTRRGLVYLFTDLIDEAAAAPLAVALPAISRRHVVTVVSLDDPEYIRARSSGTDSERSVVADIDAATDGAARLLRRSGAQVLIEPANRIAEATVRYYVQARSGTGR